MKNTCFEQQNDKFKHIYSMLRVIKLSLGITWDLMNYDVKSIWKDVFAKNVVGMICFYTLRYYATVSAVLKRD